MYASDVLVAILVQWLLLGNDSSMVTLPAHSTVVCLPKNYFQCIVQSHSSSRTLHVSYLDGPSIKNNNGFDKNRKTIES